MRASFALAIVALSASSALATSTPSTLLEDVAAKIHSSSVQRRQAIPPAGSFGTCTICDTASTTASGCSSKPATEMLECLCNQTLMNNLGDCLKCGAEVSGDPSVITQGKPALDEIRDSCATAGFTVNVPNLNAPSGNNGNTGASASPSGSASGSRPTTSTGNNGGSNTNGNTPQEDEVTNGNNNNGNSNNNGNGNNGNGNSLNGGGNGALATSVAGVTSLFGVVMGAFAMMF